MKSYKEVLDYLYYKLPMYQQKGGDALKYKLDNILSFCKELNSPQNDYPIIHVGGTNGKGSVAHMLSSILQESGLNTGLYTSPHLKNFTERIKVNGIEISETSVISFVNDYKHLTDTINPSFFEWTVAMAFDEFKKQNVDIAIVEVGLGGRLDSTNIVQPELSVITNIGKDHTHILGDTLGEIAYEKAGIIKPNTFVVVGERQAEIDSVFINRADELNAPIYFASDDEIDVYECDLKGDYQQKNIKTAIKSIQLLREKGYEISDENCVNGLKKVALNTSLKGRWQVIDEKPFTVCDTAHNESGVKEVVNQLGAFINKKLWVILGVVEDKDIDSMLKLLPVSAEYVFCEPSINRKLSAVKLKEKAEKYNLVGEVILNVNKAIDIVRKRAQKEDVIFIGGSTFVVAEIDDL